MRHKNYDNERCLKHRYYWNSSLICITVQLSQTEHKIRNITDSSTGKRDLPGKYLEIEIWLRKSCFRSIRSRVVKSKSNNIVEAIPDGHIQTLNKCSWRNRKSVDIDEQRPEKKWCRISDSFQLLYLKNVKR